MSNKKSYKKSVKLRERKLKSGNVSLYLDIYLGNKNRQYEWLGITYNPKNKPEKRQKMNMAKEIRAKREVELIAGDYDIIPAHKKRGNFVEYFEKLANERYEKKQRSYMNALHHLKEFTNGHIPFNAINEMFLEDLKSYFLSKVAKNTAHTYFSVIKAALKRAYKEKIIHYNIADKVKQIPKKKSEVVYLTLEEVKKLHQTECNNTNVKYAFLFACNTGLRISDIKRLRWDNISLEENKVIVTQKKTKESLYLPLSKSARNILNELTSHKSDNKSNKVFDLPSDTTIRKVIIKWSKEAGISKSISFHTSRHTFATLSLSLGVDLYTVSKLLGHTDIKNTQIYAKVIDENMQKAMEKLPDLDMM
jgi:integrase